MPLTYIYGLKDPETHKIRYIGKTKTPKARLSAHISRPANRHLKEWILSLMKKGRLPEMVILDWLEGEGARRLEDNLIAAFAKSGDLLNQNLRRYFYPLEQSYTVHVRYIRCLGCGQLHDSKASRSEDAPSFGEVSVLKNPINDDGMYLCCKCGRAGQFENVTIAFPWEEWWVSSSGE